jgi:16S rRNA (uracil1498-N3)-methyltransferase
VIEALRRAAAHVLVDDLVAPNLAERDAHHLFTVLRLRAGEVVTVTDGRGAWRTCRVAGDTVEPQDGIVVEPPREPVTVAVAIPKHDRPEWLVQKLTEVGVDRIVLMHTGRSVVRWDGHRGERHVDRLRRVAAEAAMQSRRVRFPQLVGPVDVAAVLAPGDASMVPGGIPVAEPGGGPLGAADRALAIGPEGGWTEAELALASRAVGLGETVMRVETAAVAAGVLLVAARDRASVVESHDAE